MDEHDVIKLMKRFPNAINPVKRMTSKAWKCSMCGHIYKFKVEHLNPSPCKICKGIYFEKLI